MGEARVAGFTVEAIKDSVREELWPRLREADSVRDPHAKIPAPVTLQTRVAREIVDAVIESLQLRRETFRGVENLSTGELISPAYRWVTPWMSGPAMTCGSRRPDSHCHLPSGHEGPHSDIGGTTWRW